MLLSITILTFTDQNLTTTWLV